jgi:predicted RNA binding protein YcfA (HicA-like mRNA interferase family)
MKWSEMKRLAMQYGWYKYRSGAKHDIYRHPDKKEQIQLERHSSQEVRPGLMKKLIKTITEN